MITVDALNGKFTCYDNDHIMREIQSCGAFSRPELQMILGYIKAGDTVLDIGAHIGTFSVPLKKAIGPDGRLFAFEANPETFKLLMKNIADNNIDVQAINKGVSAQSGTLYLRAKNLNARAGKSEQDAPINSGADYLTAAPDNSDSAIEIELVKIDDVVTGPVNFIKIDIEGMELSALRSAEKLIDQHRPIIYSEYLDYYIKRAGERPQDYEAFFKLKNYHFFINAKSRVASNDEFELVRIPGPKYIRGQVDFLLIPADSDRYPTQYKNWNTYRTHKFLWSRFRNLLSAIKATLKNF